MKRTPLNPMSKKRKAENARRSRAMLETFGHPSTWTCLVRKDQKLRNVMGECLGPVHGHEIVKRSQGGSITDTDNIVLLCDYHNGWIETHRTEARIFGLVRSNWEAK